MFTNLMSKIFSHAPTVAASTPASSQPAAAGAPAGVAAPAAATAVAAPPMPEVDVAAILNGLAAKNSETLDWKHSLVDLMKREIAPSYKVTFFSV